MSTQQQRVLVKDKGAFARLPKKYVERLFPEQLRERSRRAVVLFRPSLAGFIERHTDLNGAHLVDSMWDGYLQDSRFQSMVDWANRHQIPLTSIHTSGHASVPALRTLGEAFVPDRLVPIHTDHADRYRELFGGTNATQVTVQPDGTWWDV